MCLHKEVDKLEICRNIVMFDVFTNKMFPNKMKIDLHILRLNIKNRIMGYLDVQDIITPQDRWLGAKNEKIFEELS